MKPKLRLLVVLLLTTALAGLFIWLLRSAASPSLIFVGHRTDPLGRPLAVFRATNPSDQSYSYFGGSASPFHTYRAPAATGWQVVDPDLCGVGCTWHELAAHTSIEFEVPTLDDSTQFALGVHFVRATPSDLIRRGHSPGPLARLRQLLHKWLPAPQPTWSPPVPPVAPAPPHPSHTGETSTPTRQPHGP